MLLFFGPSYNSALEHLQPVLVPMLVLDTVSRLFNYDTCVVSVLGHPFCAERDGGPGTGITLYRDIGVRLFSHDPNILFVPVSYYKSNGVLYISSYYVVILCIVFPLVHIWLFLGHPIAI
jgi:hypothetical protein